MAAGESARQLARQLGRSPSTVSREIARNGGRDRYRAASADVAAYERGRRPKPAKLDQRPALRALVEAKLALCWSPEQVAGRRMGRSMATPPGASFCPAPSRRAPAACW
ncbi:transposase [Streptomyces sp. NPDC057611]|uniref:transposase n=1 Tax=Streptomyces sp. NPDC057611 TaxID=3346182 RepID=UPI003688E094